MKCPSCGSENFDGATFCSLCMTSLGLSETSSPSEPLSAGTGPVQSTTAPVAPSLPGNAPGPEFDANEYASGMFVEQRLDAAARQPKKGLRIPLLGSTPVSFSGLRFMVSGLVLIGAILVWGFGGGFGGMAQGKRAEVPIPAGAQLIATQESVTEGLVGSLSEERRAIYATHVFLIPQPIEEVFAYYAPGGPYDTTLSADGWMWDPDSIVEDTYMLGAWNRTTALGYRAEEEQSTVVLVQEQRLGGFDEIIYSLSPGRNPFSKVTDVSGGAVSGKSCIVAIACTGAGLDKIEFVEQ